ncbi:MAG TPA: hypothetical protein VGK29_10625 [Paludibaculum sp.]|jgi:hypothetical protein
MTLEARETQKRILGPSAACLPTEELIARLTRGDAPAQAHIGECAHCAAQSASYRDFVEVEPQGTEVFAVNWVENRTRMPWEAAPAPRRTWKSWLSNSRALAPLAMAAAALVLTVGIGTRAYFGGSPQDLSESAERSQVVELLAPKGDLPKAPEELRWAAVAGAAQYRVQILEVDRVVLWQGTTSSLAVRVPAVVRNKALPGKRLIWQVEALDSSGGELAKGSQDFRKQLNPVR